MCSMFCFSFLLMISIFVIFKTIMCSMFCFSFLLMISIFVLQGEAGERGPEGNAGAPGYIVSF